MDFEKTKLTRVIYSDLRHEFDVRTDGAVDTFAAEEMAKGKFENPLVTADLVVIDGRTAAYAQLIKTDMPQDNNAQVDVDLLPWKYDSLTPTQKTEVQAEALRRNFSQRYRRFSTEDDIVLTLSQVIRLRWPNQNKTDIQKQFLFLGSRFTPLYDNALNTIQQQKIAQARQLMKENEHLTVAAAAQKVGLSSVKGIIQTQGTAARDKTFNEMKQKQAAIQRAIAVVKNYATTRLKLLRDSRITGVTLQRLYEHETKQVLKLTKTHDDAKRRVEKELVEYIPGYHTR